MPSGSLSPAPTCYHCGKPFEPIKLQLPPDVENIWEGKQYRATHEDKLPRKKSGHYVLQAPRIPVYYIQEIEPS